jgi:hypothetical protein
MKFPDEYFPVKNSLEKDYNQKVQEGKLLSSGLNVLFCAVCKDVANVVEKSISMCHATGEYFADYRVFMYENNSSDNTAEVIESLNDDKVILHSEFIEEGSYVRANVTLEKRCTLISNARNKYVDYVNKNNNYDYIFVFDTDIEGGWSLDGVFNSIYYLENNKDFGCMTSYCVLSGPQNNPLEQVDCRNWLMFDSFAFRFYNPSDWSFPINIAKHNYIRATKGDKPTPVNSNFNGMCIYRPECFKDNKYYVKNYGVDYKTDSEHVGFYNTIWKKGLKVMLNPSMITSISNHKYSV